VKTPPQTGRCSLAFGTLCSSQRTTHDRRSTSSLRRGSLHPTSKPVVVRSDRRATARRAGSCRSRFRGRRTVRTPGCVAAGPAGSGTLPAVVIVCQPGPGMNPVGSRRSVARVGRIRRRPRRFERGARPRASRGVGNVAGALHAREPPPPTALGARERPSVGTLWWASRARSLPPSSEGPRRVSSRPTTSGVRRCGRPPAPCRWPRSGS
jgi:hypothetical protein